MVVDASVWVSYFIPGDRFHVETVAWLEAMLDAGETLTAPILLLPEVAGAVARRARSSALGMEVAQQVLTWPTLRLLHLDETLMMLATEMASAVPIKGADAVYLATAQRQGTPLITWDAEQLNRGGRIVSTRSPADVA